MTRKATTIHLYLLYVWLAGLVATVFLAGLGVFEVTTSSALAKGSTKLVEANRLDPHRIAGSLLVLGTLLVLIVAFTGRGSRRQVGASVAFFALGIVQLILAGAGSGSGAAWGGLHVVNAFLLTGIAVGLVLEDRRVLGRPA
ncbi:MAG: hypothetical protein ABI317_13310 [Gaiellales bacterium]